MKRENSFVFQKFSAIVCGYTVNSNNFQIEIRNGCRHTTAERSVAMSWLEILLIGAGLSLDVLAYALCRGAVIAEVSKKNLLKMCAMFVVWNLLSLTAGNLLVKIPVLKQEAGAVSKLSNYISVLIFLGLGIYLIIKAVKEKAVEEHKIEHFEFHKLAIWTAITSVDVFLAGIGFGFQETDFLKTLIALLVLTPISVVLGVYIGYWAGCQARRKIVTAGGCLLLLGAAELLLRLT